MSDVEKQVTDQPSAQTGEQDGLGPDPLAAAPTMATPEEATKLKQQMKGHFLQVSKNEKEAKKIMKCSKNITKAEVYLQRAVDSFQSAQRVQDDLMERIPEEQEEERQELVYSFSVKKTDFEEFMDQAQEWISTTQKKIVDEENDKAHKKEEKKKQKKEASLQLLGSVSNQIDKSKSKAAQFISGSMKTKSSSSQSSVKSEVKHKDKVGAKSKSKSGSESEIDFEIEKKKDTARLAELKEGWAAYEKQIMLQCALEKEKYLKEIQMLEGKTRAYSEMDVKPKVSSFKYVKKPFSVSSLTKHNLKKLSTVVTADEEFEDDVFTESDTSTSESSESDTPESSSSEDSSSESSPEKKKSKCKKKKYIKKDKKKASKSRATVIVTQPKTYTFDGDPLKFDQFLKRFESRVEKQAEDYVERLTLLQEAVEGSTAEKIVAKGWGEKDIKLGYKKVMKALKKTYQHPQLMANTYLHKLDAWDEISNDDGQSLQELADYMEKCLLAKKYSSDLAALDTSAYVTAVFHKLPGFLQNKWTEKVLQLKENGQMFPSFKDITKFVVRQAELMNDPVYGRKAVKSYRASRVINARSNQTKSRPTARSFATYGEASRPDRVQCLMCAGAHVLDECSALMEKGLSDRKTFLINNQLCFRCLKPGHIATKCTEPLTCRKCSRKHPTCLHYGTKPQTDTVAAGHAITDETCTSYNAAGLVSNHINPKQVYHAVVPVMVRSVGYTEAVCTYAFLDSGSSACFITQSICDQLDVTGIPTSLTLRTLHGDSVSQSEAYTQLEITDMTGQNSTHLPRVFARPDIGINKSCVPDRLEMLKWPHLHDVAKQMSDVMESVEIGLLLGSNCPEALEPIKVISSQGTGLFASKMRHGWTIQGSVGGDSVPFDVMVNRAAVREAESLKELIVNMYEREFSDDLTPRVDQKDMSPADQKFMELVREGTKYEGGHYIVPMPLKEDPPAMPNNRKQAVHRAQGQAKKMARNEKYRNDYVAFIQKMLHNGYARPVTEEDRKTPEGSIWYLPHHGVLHPAKQKLRVVFDGAACFGPVSLNSSLYQGPNMLNTIVGVMLRFRQHDVAMTADIESMYHRVHVPAHQQSLLRFVWWPDGELSHELQDFCMTSHVFGAVSSPSVAIYALRKTAEEHALDSETRDAVMRGFYVDDWLMSCPNASEAADLAEKVRICCAKGGFRLTKFLSNSQSVLDRIPETERAESVMLGLLDDKTDMIERTLGLFWHISSDTLRFSLSVKSKPFTRRGVLSTISSVYDPLGVLAPALLPAKHLLQSLCRETRVDWDDDLPSEHYSRWEKWLRDLPKLNQIQIPRSFGLSGDVGETQHVAIYADASSVGQAAVAYMDVPAWQGGRTWAFIVGKARIAPLKAVATIPKLELAAAVTAVNLAASISTDLQYPLTIDFYTDSEAVLKFIANEHQRQTVYVSNRVRLIRSRTDLTQWHHVASSDNPADVGSRGLSPAGMVADSKWLYGPARYNSAACVDASVFHANEPNKIEHDPDPVPVIQEMVMRMLDHYSSWWRIRKAVVYFWKFVSWRREKKFLMAQGVMLSREKFLVNMTTTASEAAIAERALLVIIQQNAFGRDYSDVMALGCVNIGSKLSKFAPFLDDGLLRVGGRLQRAELSFDQKHPVLLPKNSRATTLIVRMVHSRIAHAGRAHTLSQLRQRFWVLGGMSTVRQALHACVICRKVSGKFHGQIMAPLPAERTDPAPPFTHVGVDYFGPFTIRKGRTDHKRYGVIFTCLGIRACHLEVASSLQADTFILALRRFISRRGTVTTMFSDNGTNFTGAEKELARAVQNMDHARVSGELCLRDIDWKFNPPYASHAGGVWERHIRTVRKHLNSILSQFPGNLTEEGLATVFCEIEAIINSRPLTALSDEPSAPLPLSPEQLLTMKSTHACAAPGIFTPEDSFSKKTWRRVQHIADTFWSRWTRDYLSTLQPRSKWTHPRPNLLKGDVVLIKDEQLFRGQWPVGVITASHPDDQGKVRTVTLRTAFIKELTRSVHKLVYLFTDTNV